MAANGISTQSTKAARQSAKLVIAQGKKQGKTVALNGTVSGSIDATKGFYRYWNTYSSAELPSVYTGNANTPQVHASGLQPHRPWTVHS